MSQRLVVEIWNVIWIEKSGFTHSGAILLLLLLLSACLHVKPLFIPTKKKIPQKVWILHKLGLKLQALSIFYRLLSPPVLQPHCANTLITKNFNSKPKNCISITRFGQRTSNRRSVWFLLPPVLLYSLLICLTEHPKWSCPLTWVGS